MSPPTPTPVLYWQGGVRGTWGHCLGGNRAPRRCLGKETPGRPFPGWPRPESVHLLLTTSTTAVTITLATWGAAAQPSGPGRDTELQPGRRPPVPSGSGARSRDGILSLRRRGCVAWWRWTNPRRPQLWEANGGAWAGLAEERASCGLGLLGSARAPCRRAARGKDGSRTQHWGSEPARARARWGSPQLWARPGRGRPRHPLPWRRTLQRAAAPPCFLPAEAAGVLQGDGGWGMGGFWREA